MVKRIERYGRFTPSGRDTSAQKRMAALAGLGESIAQTGVFFSEKLASEKAIEDAKIKAEQALEKGVEPEKKQFFEFGSETYNRAVTAEFEKAKKQADLQFAVGIQNDAYDFILEQLNKTPDDVLAFDKAVLSYYPDLSKNVAPELKLKIDQAFRREFLSARETVLKNQKENTTLKAKEEAAKAEVNFENQQSNLAAQGNAESLAASIREQDGFAVAAGSEIVDLAKYYEEKESRMAILRQVFTLGTVRREIIQNDEIPSDLEKLKRLNNFVADLKKQNVLAIPDPENPGKFINVDDKERKSIIKAVEEEVKDFESLLTKRVTQTTLEDKIAKVENYEKISSYIEDETISAEEKLLFINTQELQGLIDTEKASIARRYVTSEKALNAITDNKIYGDIIDRIYGLNADLSISGQNADYLEGLANIDAYIKTARADGKLNRNDEIKLRREMKNLTAAKKAEALSTLSVSYYKANRIIKENVRPDLMNVVRARLFERVQSETQKLEEEGQTVSRAKISGFWQLYALSTAREVQEEERQRSKESVQNVLSRTQPKKPPTITTQAEYDNLRSGDLYIFNGKTARKP